MQACSRVDWIFVTWIEWISHMQMLVKGVAWHDQNTGHGVIQHVWQISCIRLPCVWSFVSGIYYHFAAMDYDYVSSLQKSFHWAAVCVRTLLARFGQGVLNTGLCQAACLSSHCSGCGSAEVSCLGVMSFRWMHVQVSLSQALNWMQSLNWCSYQWCVPWQWAVQISPAVGLASLLLPATPGASHASCGQYLSVMLWLLYGKHSWLYATKVLSDSMITQLKCWWRWWRWWFLFWW